MVSFSAPEAPLSRQTLRRVPGSPQGYPASGPKVVPPAARRLPTFLIRIFLITTGLITTGLIATCLFTSPVRSQTLDDARELFAAGRVTEAAAAFRAAAEASPDPTTEATARNNACVLLTNLGDAATALGECERALELRQTLGDDRGLSRTLNNLALAQQNLGRSGAAVASYEKAIAVNQRRGDAEAETLVRSNLGWLWTSTGSYSQAIAQLDRALGLAAAHATEPWAARQQALVQINYGVLLEKLGAYREALELYGKLLTDAPGLDRRQRATLELNRGVMYRNLGDPFEALTAFETAAHEFEALEDTVNLSNAWLNIGLARHHNLGQLEDAELAYGKALSAARGSGNVGEEIQDLIHLGRLYLDRGELEAASTAFETCLDLAETSGSSEGRWAAFEGRGRVSEASGNLELARRDFERAVVEIEGTRAELDQHERRVGYFGDKRSVTAALVGVLAALAAEHPTGNDAEKAWEWVQRAKSRELLDAVGDRGPPLTAAELGPLLGEGALLELFFGEHKLFAWVGTAADGLRLVDLGPSAPVIDQALNLSRTLAVGDPRAAEATAALSAILIAATDVLGSDPDHLWVTADGPLRRIPFEVLDIGGKKLIDRLTVSYLPNTSALARIRSRSKEVMPASPMLAALGNPSLAAAEPTESALATPGEILTQRFSLAPLPQTAHELVAITAALGLPSDLRLGEKATERSFRELAASAGPVLHLATHTLLDDRPGGGAAILLSPGNGAGDGTDGTDGTDDDGLLWARELRSIPVHKRLTVLSACRSALDPSRDTDALSSLTGALLAAGSSAVVASLWDVDDAATAVFMEQLYFQLGRGLWPAEALRQTKLRLRSDPRWNRPNLWAAFILVGDTGPLVEPRSAILPWTLGLAALLLAAWLWWSRSRRSRLRHGLGPGH